MSHELLLAFDPGDPDASDAEFAAALEQVRSILPDVDSDQVVWLLEMSGKAKRRYQQLNWTCFEEMQRRKLAKGGPTNA